MCIYKEINVIVDAPIHKTSLRRSGIARTVNGSHSFTCTPCLSSASGMSHTCLCLPSRSWYSFTDTGGMEGCNVMSQKPINYWPLNTFLITYYLLIHWNRIRVIRFQEPGTRIQNRFLRQITTISLGSTILDHQLTLTTLQLRSPGVAVYTVPRNARYISYQFCPNSANLPYYCSITTISDAVSNLREIKWFWTKLLLVTQRSADTDKIALNCVCPAAMATQRHTVCIPPLLGHGLMGVLMHPPTTYILWYFHLPLRLWT